MHPERSETQLAARVGTTLKGKWHIDALIGFGGMAAVYAATHRNRKRAAIKILHRELSDDTDIRKRFLREGYVANTVAHPGAVVVDDDDVTDDGSAYLVMELLEGESLQARAERLGPLGWAEVLQYTHQLLDILAAAHAKGIVHRDIKPDNLFLTRTGQVKVLDFGIARLRDRVVPAAATVTGFVLGTPAFMAPEQASGAWDQVDARTDLWAVGATMFTSLTGRFVHQAETLNLHLVAACTKTAPPIASLIPALPSPVAEVIDRALAYEKVDRWRDARSMQTAVGQCLRDCMDSPGGFSDEHITLRTRDRDEEARHAVAPSASTNVGLSHDSPGPRPRHTRSLVVVASVVGLALLVTGYLFARWLPRSAVAPSVPAGQAATASAQPVGVTSASQTAAETTTPMPASAVPSAQPARSANRKPPTKPVDPQPVDIDPKRGF